MGEILGREIPGAEAVNLDAWEAELARHLDGLGADAAAPLFKRLVKESIVKMCKKD